MAVSKSAECMYTLPMDILTSMQRHKVMSSIRSRNTVPEKQVRSALHRAGFRFRICDRRYPGKPDLVLPRYYAVIFINGCFWHAHENCRFFKVPKSNREFWERKFLRNRERDSSVMDYYRNECWRVCVIWECSIRGRKARDKIDRVTSQVIDWLEEPGDPFLEIRGPVAEGSSGFAGLR